MACRLSGAKPLSEPMLSYCQLDPKEHISVKFHLNLKVFIHGNSPENVVCQSGGHLARPQCVIKLAPVNSELGI